jgi:hypothetical protein
LIRAASGDVRDATVFAPFSIRFRPFMGGCDRAKMPWDKAFRTSPLENPDCKRPKRVAHG